MEFYSILLLQKSIFQHINIYCPVMFSFDDCTVVYIDHEQIEDSWKYERMAILYYCNDAYCKMSTI